MKLEDRRRGLLRLVDECRDQECRRSLDQARAQARELMQRTYRRERAHLRQAILAERSRAQARIQAARAERATRERRLGERTSHDLLAAAWPRLRERLLSHWRDPDQRRRWVAGCLQQGIRVLPQGHWTIRHAPDWVANERAAQVAGHLGALDAEPRFESDEGLLAGLIIESRGAELDASLEGLLRDRPRIEARLLALIGGRGAP